MDEPVDASDIRENTIASKNRRIARNTLLLYVRMLFIMGVSLYTSAWCLQCSARWTTVCTMWWAEWW